MKLFTSSREPKKLEEAGNGLFTYRYGITRSQDLQREGKEPKPQYKFCKVQVKGPVTSNKLFAAILAAEYPDELKILNEYLAAKEGFYEDPAVAKAKVDAYLEFSADRIGLKESILADCKELGIE